MNSVFKFLINDFLTEPVILIGLLICVGYILNKEKLVKIITGTISAMVGIQMVIFGGTQFSSNFKPITTAVANSFGIQGYIMDSYAMKSATQEALGNAFGLVGYVFLIAFAVNLLLVYFGRYTKAKGVFLTGNAGIAHSQAILWLVIAFLGLANTESVLISGVLVGFYWAYSTTLAAKTVDDVTGGAGFTIGHNQQIGIWFFGKIAKFFGKPEQDAENLRLPGWLSIFNNNVTSVALIMTIFVGAFMAPLGIGGIQKVAGKTHQCQTGCQHDIRPVFFDTFDGQTDIFLCNVAAVYQQLPGQPHSLLPVCCMYLQSDVLFFNYFILHSTSSSFPSV